MSVITRVPEPNLWDEICKDFQSRRPPFKDDDQLSVHTNLENYDASVHNPVFYGNMYKKIEVDTNTSAEFDASASHPSCVGYAFVERPPISPPPSPAPLPDKNTCSPREYLDHHIFPILLPALEEMLREAKKERCFERKRTKFNALDFLTQYLYSNNKRHEERGEVPLAEIPFVKEHWKDHPRPPLPKSLLWSEEEASLKIQSFWRGYKARLDPEVQELRAWQKEWREENGSIKNKVDDFWTKQMPEGESGTEQVEKSDVMANEEVFETPAEVPAAGAAEMSADA
ncbi:hypothetical protein CAPTEDRAFT_148275 [Capitella teleta]|uniref:IQ domain-containing protein K n=1 Tax=Capitella teleta TaxID=283909 RepID=R7UIZ7_CAPTE|nr:hypothetical protein CAPTEDRAFT_148275 [Capitella teleta]|eukprot:ELU06529.1 hypothetical protein CAPTEDRAFT_148275 [Capitella teleta]